MNKVILLGNLVRDVEMRYAQSGLGIAKVAIATNRKYKTQQGEQKEEVCFVDLSMFGRTAEVANQYLRKGSKVLVEGRLVLEQWTDRNGQKRSKHGVTVENMQMIGNGNDNSDHPGNQTSNYQNSADSAPSQRNNGDQNEKQTSGNVPEIDLDNEEPPF